MRPDADTVGRAVIFEALGPADRQALALCFRGRRYASGEVVFREGDPGYSLLLVGEGMLAAVRAGSVTRELGRYGAGQVLGASTMVERAPRPATVTAVVPSVVYELDADTVDLLRASAPVAARALKAAGLQSLILKLRQLEHRIERELDQDSAGPPRPGAR
jgi:CRP-like cAMP-binding protein